MTVQREENELRRLVSGITRDLTSKSEGSIRKIESEGSINQLTLFIIKHAPFFQTLINREKLLAFYDIQNVMPDPALQMQSQFDSYKNFILGMLRNPLVSRKLAQKILISIEGSLHKNLRSKDQLAEILATVSKKIRQLDLSEDFFNAINDYQTSKDPLSGLDNRNYLENYHKFMEQMGMEPIVAFIDFDYFKKINDDFGHAAGDAAICIFAEVCREHWSEFREYDRLIRYGGDEFLMLFYTNKNQAEAERNTLIGRINKILAEIAQEFLNRLNGIETKEGQKKIGQVMGLSIGIMPPQKETDFGQLIKIADDGMYEAKESKAPGTYHIRLPKEIR